jgi:hypothetical protein
MSYEQKALSSLLKAFKAEGLRDRSPPLTMAKQDLLKNYGYFYTYPSDCGDGARRRPNPGKL